MKRESWFTLLAKSVIQILRCENCQKRTKGLILQLENILYLI